MSGVILAAVGVVVVLEADGHNVTVADPSGGTCDAAGDFDRLLPLDAEAYPIPILGRIHPWAQFAYDARDMAAMVPEIDQLLAAARVGVERRGLLRLRALALHGQDQPGSRLLIIGD